MMYNKILKTMRQFLFISDAIKSSETLALGATPLKTAVLVEKGTIKNLPKLTEAWTGYDLEKYDVLELPKKFIPFFGKLNEEDSVYVEKFIKELTNK